VKNIIENVAITLLILLFMFIIAMIIQYKIIDNESNIEKSYVSVTEKEEMLPKAKRDNYLESLETYTEVEVDVDPRKEKHVNRVEITSELANDEMETAISNANKLTSYENNLNNYSKKIKVETHSKTADELKKEQKEDDRIKLEKDEIVDEIGMAIGAALEDI